MFDSDDARVYSGYKGSFCKLQNYMGRLYLAQTTCQSVTGQETEPKLFSNPSISVQMCVTA